MIADVTGRLLPSSLLVRRLTATDGPVDAVIEFDPRLGDHHRPPRVEHRGDVVVCGWSTTALALRASPPLRLQAGRPVRVRVAPGQLAAVRVLWKLEYLAVRRSFQLLILHARGDAAEALELLVLLPRSRWSCLFVRPETLLRWHQRLIAGT